MPRKEEALLQLTCKSAKDKAGIDRERRINTKDRDGGNEEGKRRGKESLKVSKESHG